MNFVVIERGFGFFLVTDAYRWSIDGKDSFSDWSPISLDSFVEILAESFLFVVRGGLPSDPMVNVVIEGLSEPERELMSLLTD